MHDASTHPSAEPALFALFEELAEPMAPVAIILSAESQRATMRLAEDELASRGIQFQTHVVNPYLDAPRVTRFADSCAMRGVRVIIATAAHSAMLPALLASHTDVPVIGVPLTVGPLGGIDALLATAQMPPEVPVACMAIDGAQNAAVFAAHILSSLPLGPHPDE